jgi:ATP-dependent DNA ligase
MIASPTGFPLPPDTPPMEAKLVAALPDDAGWQFEPKWDGFRCLAFRAGDAVELRAKSGKPLTRYFPETAARLRAVAPARFVLDGELAVPAGASLSFDALQMRLHPSERRVQKLADETPAVLILFDLLAAPDGAVLLDQPLAQRRVVLEGFHASLGDQASLPLSPRSCDPAEAARWLAASGGAFDGVVAKRLDGSYHPGERAMLKVKRQRSADCVVGGFRYERGTRLVGSLLLGLYDDEGKLDHVGFTATLHDLDRAALTRRLEELIMPPGFTGNAPGGPSRWSTERSNEWQPLRPELVVEVRYDQVTGNRLRHGSRFLRWRPDKAPEQCTFGQLRRSSPPPDVVTRLLRSATEPSGGAP